MARRGSNYKTSYKGRREQDNKKWRRSTEQARDRTSAMLAMQGSDSARYFEMYSSMQEQRNVLALYKAEGAVIMGGRPSPAEEMMSFVPMGMGKRGRRGRAGKGRGRPRKGRVATKVARRNPATKATTKAQTREQLRDTQVTSQQSHLVTQTFRAIKHDLVQLNYEIKGSRADPDTPAMNRSQMERAHDIIFRFYQECAALYTNHPRADAACDVISKMLEGQMFNEQLVQQILDHYLQISTG